MVGFLALQIVCFGSFPCLIRGYGRDDRELNQGRIYWFLIGDGPLISQDGSLKQYCFLSKYILMVNYLNWGQEI